LISGRALFTPATLGHAVLQIFGPSDPGIVATVASYTVLHYIAFIIVGMTAAMVVNFARQEPSVLLCFVVLFAAIEVGFYAGVSLLQYVTPLGTLAWYNVMIGNLLAATAMGTYLVRLHPILIEQFKHAIDGVPIQAPHGR
jgi:uncharacterized membrane protein YgdD (TMEM256/DUF423 family)